MNTVTLHCEQGNHSWERPSQRGKRPRNCPQHQPEKAVVTTTGAASLAAKNANGTVTLHCELGDHSWERQSQRGKRPTSCPDCKARAEFPENRQPRARAERVAIAVDPELVSLYMEANGISERVATAFVFAGAEPPYQWQIDERGFSSKDNEILDKIATDNFNEADFDGLVV